MALAAAARRSLASRLSSHLHAALPRLPPTHCSGDATTAPSPLHPAAQPLFRPPHFPIPQSSSTAAQTLSLFPFGVHLAGAGPFRRGFSLSTPYRVADAGAVLTDAAATPAAPASIPSEVASIAEDSSLSVAALQHLIDAVHSFTGLNWWLSIAVSTVLLRSVLFTLRLSFRKQFLVAHEELSAIKKLRESAEDEKSQHEAEERLISFFKRELNPGLEECYRGHLTSLARGPFATGRDNDRLALAFPFSVHAFGIPNRKKISNMVQTLPSLKEGGAFWFTDLTTPDAQYIFPALISLSLLLRLEFSLHYSKTERCLESDVVQILFVLTFPFAANFPKAICCYFVTWSFASLALMIVINQPAVKKLLFSKPNEQTCPLSEGLTGPTTEDSLPSEQKEASDSSVDQARDQSDKKSEKDN